MNGIVADEVKRFLGASRPLPSLRQLLLLLAFACVVPMAALALGMVGLEYQRQRTQLEADTVATARALMAAIDDRLQGTQRALLALAHSPSSARAEYDHLQLEAAMLQRAEQFENVVLVDASGRLVMNSAVPLGAPLPAQPVPQAVAVLRDRAPVVLDLFRATESGRFLVGVSVPAPDHGGGPAALHATLSPDALREVLMRQKLPAHWIAAVLDRSGAIVARTHEHDRFVGTRARAPLVERIGEVPEDAVESVTLDGTPVITAFSRSDRSGWSVAIGIPRSEFTSPTVRAVTVLMLGGAVVMAGTLALAWWMARRLSDSVETLGAAVRASGHRAQLELPAPVFQEAHQLAMAFAHAHAALEDAREAQGRSEARMRTILDTATDAVVTADQGGRIVLFNAAAEALFRIPAEHALGLPLEALVPADARALHEHLRQQAGAVGGRRMAGGRLIRGLRGDGSIFHAQASLSVAEAGEEGRLYTAILREVPQPEATAA